jgi:hypothetical protein
MSRKFRLREVEIDGYYFINVDGLFWHGGKFWYNETEVKRVYNNGSLSILLYGSQKLGVKKLRKYARKCKIKIFTEQLPF